MLRLEGMVTASRVHADVVQPSPLEGLDRITTREGLEQNPIDGAIEWLPSYILLSTRRSRVETRLTGEPVVDREISIVTRAGSSLSPAAADFAAFAKHHVRESLASDKSSSRSR